MPETSLDTSRHPTPRAWAVGNVGFAVVLVVVVAAYASLFWEQLHSGLEFDEAYNLSVAMNLADGHGYAAQGAAHGELRKVFDPLISTGPTLLVPTAAMWALGDGFGPLVRLVPLGFFALYLAGMWVAGRRIGGRWAAAAALIAPMVLPVAVPDLATHSLVPGRVVGEFTACALLVWAALLLPGQRARTVALGGLAAGLAFETKTSFVFAIALLGIAWLLAESLAHRITLVRASAAAVGVATPVVAFEVYRWASLGNEAYLENTAALRTFADNQTHAPTLDAVLPRVDAMATATLTDARSILLVLAMILALVGTVSLARLLTQSAEQGIAGATLLALGAGGILLGVMWLTTSFQPSLRQGLPTLLLCLPLVFALAARGISTLAARATDGLQDLVQGGAVALLATWLGVTALTQTWGATFHTRLLDEQVAAARSISESGSPSIMTNGWFMHVEYQLLTGLPSDRAPGAKAPKVRISTPIEGAYVPGMTEVQTPNICPSAERYASWAVILCPVD